MDAIRGKRKLKNKGGRKKRGDPAPGVLRGKTDKPNHLARARPLKQQKAPQQTASYLTAHWGHHYLSICNYPNSQAVGSSSADCECLTAPWNHFYFTRFSARFFLKQEKAPQQTASCLTAHWGHHYLSVLSICWRFALNSSPSLVCILAASVLFHRPCRP